MAMGPRGAKAFRTFIRIYSLLKSGRLSANVKLTLHKALMRSVMTYACPAWELVADTYLYLPTYNYCSTFIRSVFT
jgi:hypothetical protein